MMKSNAFEENNGNEGIEGFGELLVY